MSSSRARKERQIRRAVMTRYAAVTANAGTVVIDEERLLAEFEAAGGRPAYGVDLGPLGIRGRLGPKQWGPPIEWGNPGWRFTRYDHTALILVTASCWPELPDVPVIHASMSRHNPAGVPTYEDLCLLHRAVWPDGHAIQCFVPPDEHIDLRPNVLHLWGRNDGKPLWPIDFGRFGSI